MRPRRKGEVPEAYVKEGLLAAPLHEPEGTEAQTAVQQFAIGAARRISWTPDKGQLLRGRNGLRKPYLCAK
jgi:hypothetical protein